MVIETEFASVLRVLRREGNILSATMRQAWDTGRLRVLTKNSPAQSTDAHISVIAHITPDELCRHLDNTEAGNGFGNRFLWPCARRSKELPEGGNIQSVNFAPLIKRLREAIDFARSAKELKRDEDARAVWHAVYHELSAGKPGLLGAVTSRAEAQVMRLALVYALLDCSPVIRREHLEAALALWKYCEASARFIFGDALGDPIADEILRALRAAPNGLTRSEIRDLSGRNHSSQRIGQALGLLQAQGLVRRETQESGERGRPAEVWFAV